MALRGHGCIRRPAAVALKTQAGCGFAAGLPLKPRRGVLGRPREIARTVADTFNSSLAPFAPQPASNSSLVGRAMLGSRRRCYAAKLLPITS
jgi:hypothetical protein